MKIQRPVYLRKLIDSRFNGMITILMLVAVILLGSMTANAKTTKKKSNSKARTTQTASSKELPKFEDFYVWGYNPFLEKNGYLIQNKKSLQSNLSKIGYSYKGIETIHMTGDFYKFNRTGGPELLISEETAGEDIYIRFKNNSALKEYWDYLKSIGFKETPDNGRRWESETIYEMKKDNVITSYSTGNMYGHHNTIVFFSHDPL